MLKKDFTISAGRKNKIKPKTIIIVAIIKHDEVIVILLAIGVFIRCQKCNN